MGGKEGRRDEENKIRTKEEPTTFDPEVDGQEFYQDLNSLYLTIHEVKKVLMNSFMNNSFSFFLPLVHLCNP